MKTRLLLLALTQALLFSSVAGLPQPDNLIYGTISFSGIPVTSTNTNFSVEARRTLLGPAVASYRMGSSSDAGQFFYVLRLQIETAPAQKATSLELGNTVFIIVKDDAGGIRAQKNFTLATAGDVARLDFGGAIDANGNGIPDDWEITNGYDNGDRDNDGTEAFGEYVAGTDPSDGNSRFSLSLSISNKQSVVSFLGRQALGVGYEGRTRYYSLERSTNLLKGPWQALTNYDRVAGQNKAVTYVEPAATNAPSFFRARVWLEGP
jgi:hypothetical protein